MFTHVDDKTNMPTMVDITNKDVSQRMAKAQSLVQLPIEIKPYLNGKELTLKKGPVFQTAIIAGTMAVKKTHDLIPFCHQIPIEGCKINITISDDLLVTIECEVKTTFKTGVEMEALSGASVAALTVYDMCKAISHNIVIKETRLLSKSGGKRLVPERPLYGLVLTGGKSSRMKTDKALIAYNGVPHAQYIYDTLKSSCQEVYISSRPGQWVGTALEKYPALHDSVSVDGPMAGIVSALQFHPEADWFIVACDLVHFDKKTVETLLANFHSEKIATTFKNSDKGFPESLCAVYTPKAQQEFLTAIANGVTCPVKVLKNCEVYSIEQTDGIDLANINTPEEFKEVQNEVR